VRVELSKRAQQDIERQTNYLIERDVEAAAAFVAALDKVFTLLAEHPLAGGLVLLKSRRAPVRRWVLAPMAIFYEPRGEVLYVISVRHGARRPITKWPAIGAGHEAVPRAWPHPEGRTGQRGCGRDRPA
jgi:plasmid stabilization system protein ParE